MTTLIGHFIRYNDQLFEHKQLNNQSHHQLHVDVVQDNKVKFKPASG